jgi:dephospho-CoA kinase
VSPADPGLMLQKLTSRSFYFSMLLGLTGGMGCGKSTAAHFFSENGFRTVDADGIVHELLERDPEVKQAISDRFGPEAMDADGRVNRRILGQIVFADGGALAWLEGIIHPRVGERWRAEVAHEADSDWVIQIPLLFEKKLEDSFDFTVCVGASGETQQQRLLQRGLTQDEIARRLARQLSIEEKTARSDFFILNDGSLDFLRLQVAHLCHQLRRPSSGSSLP